MHIYYNNGIAVEISVQIENMFNDEKND